MAVQPVKLVSDWRSSWRWASVQLITASAGLQAAFLALPADLAHKLPSGTDRWIAISVLALAGLGRIIEQPAPTGTTAPKSVPATSPQPEIIAPMNLAALKSWLLGLAAHPDPNVVAAGETLLGALKQGETVIPTVAKDAVNAVLDHVPGGSAVEGSADDAVVGLVTELLSQSSNPAAALASVQAAVAAKGA